MRNYFITCLLLLLPFGIYPQSHTIRFETLNAEDGLTQNTIVDIVQDQKGFIWIATQDGLNKYDGFGVKTFIHNKSDSNSISLNTISSLCIDEHTLWLGLDGTGISKLDLATEDFTNYRTEFIQKNGMSVFALFNDGNTLWLGTNEGLFVFDKEKENYEYVPTLSELDQPLSPHQQERVYTIAEIDREKLYVGMHGGVIVIDKKSRKITHTITTDTGLPHFWVRSILKDQQARFWFGTYDGLLILHPDGRKEVIKGNDQRLPDRRIISSFQDSNNNIWLGTFGGLVLVQEKIDQLVFTSFTHASDDKFSLSNNRVYSIFEDRTSTLWFGTYFGGISKYDRSRNKFHLMPGTRFSSPIIRSICKDESGNIWVGTQKGLNKVDAQTQQVTTFFKGNTNNSLSGNIIRSLYMSPYDHQLYVGTGNAGLCVYSPKSNRFRRINSDALPLNDTDIRVITQTDANTIWIGTAYKGLIRWQHPNTAQEKWTQYAPDQKAPYQISSHAITAIHLGRDSTLWVSTWNGLNRIDLATDTLKAYVIESHPSMATNAIKSVTSDGNHKIWIATAGGGIQQLVDEEKGLFKTYDQSNGLPNNYVYAILIDQYENLWMSTNRGISKFNPNTEAFRNYDVYDGLQDNEFNTGAYVQASDGQLFFGGIKGLNFFYPEEIQDNKQQAFPVITNLKIFNRDITIGHLQLQDRHHLAKHISYYNRLDLNRDESVFSLYFSAMHYANQSKNKFAYRMVGFDEQWNFTDARTPFATYTNLAADTYTFQVKATNNDGVWNKTPVELEIVIHPPFWQLWYVKAILVLFVAFLINSIYQYRLRKIAKQKLYLEQVVSERTQEIQEKNKHLEESREELKAANEELESANKKLATSEAQLRVSEEEIRQYNSELLAINENLSHMTRKLEETLTQEQASRKLAEDAHNELKAAEVQLIQREKMAALGTLTAGIAHEVNNPINYVVSGVYALDIIVNDLHEVLTKYNELEKMDDVTLIRKELQAIKQLKKELQLETVHGDCLTILTEIKRGADKV
ncbi:MAG: ligand-binding sensor domain-containing protein, partial [Flammeovirgaceae bacterium]